MIDASTLARTALLAPIAMVAACASPMPPADVNLAGFEGRIEAIRSQLLIPGVSAIVMKDQQVLWTKGFGFADLENRVPATPDTIYHIASVTKTFAATLVMQLAEQGKLDLDEPASHYSADFKDDSVRIRHLLSHTSKATPGQAFEYDGMRYDHLTAVIEKKTGKTFREVVMDVFVRPLGMSGTFTSPQEVADASRIAQPYTRYGDEIVHAFPPIRFFGAAAGLLSTARDLAKYDAALDRHVFMKAETQARAWTPFVSNAGQRLPYGFGWFVEDYGGTDLVWHTGHWGTGYSAIYVKAPKRNLSLILLGNSEAVADHNFGPGDNPWTMRTNAFACAFVRLVVLDGTAHACDRESEVAMAKWIQRRRDRVRTAIAVDAPGLEPYVGRYAFRTFERTLTITREGARLFADTPRNYRSEMYPESESRFFLKTRPVAITFVREGGKVAHLDFAEGGETLRADRLPD